VLTLLFLQNLLNTNYLTSIEATTTDRRRWLPVSPPFPRFVVAELFCSSSSSSSLPERRARRTLIWSFATRSLFSSSSSSSSSSSAAVVALANFFFFFASCSRLSIKSQIFSYCAREEEWLVSPRSSVNVVDDGKSARRIALVTVRLKVDLTSLPPSMAN
jgi:hypothetical protein